MYSSKYKYVYKYIYMCIYLEYFAKQLETTRLEQPCVPTVRSWIQHTGYQMNSVKKPAEGHLE